MRNGKIIIKKDRRGEWRLSVRAPNGRIVHPSGGIPDERRGLAGAAQHRPVDHGSRDHSSQVRQGQT